MIPFGQNFYINWESTLRKYLKLQTTEKAVIATKDFEGIILMEKPKKS